MSFDLAGADMDKLYACVDTQFPIFRAFEAEREIPPLPRSLEQLRNAALDRCSKHLCQSGVLSCC
jgi:hypothetical protein